MELNKPSFPISFTLEENNKLIEDLLKKKHWKNFKILETKLVYVPFWFFNYEAFLEIEKEKGKHVSDSVHGRMALNAVNNELSDKLAYILEEQKIQLIKQPDHDFDFLVQDLTTTKEEAKNVAAVRLASDLKLPKENIIISGLQLVFVPVWLSVIKLNHKATKLMISAINGKILNEHIIKERKMGWKELTQETLNELSNPSTWGHYISGTAKTSARIASKNLKTLLWALIVAIIIVFIIFLIYNFLLNLFGF